MGHILMNEYESEQDIGVCVWAHKEVWGYKDIFNVFNLTFI